MGGISEVSEFIKRPTGISIGTGTRMTAARMAIRWAWISIFLCCLASEKICCQLIVSSDKGVEGVVTLTEGTQVER